MMQRRTLFLAGTAALALAGTARAQEAGGSTFESVQRTKRLRVAAFPGADPYFRKDLASGTWTGAGVVMAQDIAGYFDAQLEFVESTYGNAVLDLQANKIDLGFAMTPTPRRALSIDFSNPYLMNSYGVIAKPGFTPRSWADLNHPELRVAIELGSVHETAARSFAPKAQIMGFKLGNETLLALQAGHVDCLCIAGFQGLMAAKRNPSLGKFFVLQDPVLVLPSCIGIRAEPDGQWRRFLNAWADYNRGTEQVRKWMMDGLTANGLQAADVPPEITF